MVEHNFFKLFINLLLFAEDDVTFALNSTILEFRVLQNIADDVNSCGDVLAEALGVIDGLFAGSVGVEVCAEVLDLDFEGVLCPSVGSLECHMFEEVGGAVGFVSFSTRTGVNPDADSCSLCMWMRLGGDGQTVRESANLRNRSCIADGGIGSEGSLFGGYLSV